MDRKGIIALMLALIVVSGGFMVLVYNNDGGKASAGVTVVDAEGRNVTTSETPMRIVSCSPSLTEIVYSLGLGDRLVAVSSQCDWPSDIVQKKENGTVSIMGDYYSPNVDLIMEADPDLVLIDQGVEAQVSIMPQLDDVELNYIVLNKGTTFDEIFESILMTGKICWQEAKAQQVIGSMQERMDEISETIGNDTEEPTVAFILYLDPIYVVGGGTYIDDMIIEAGGQNVYSGLSAWSTVTVESILDVDPDYVFITTMLTETSGDSVLQTIRNDTLWSATSAVQNNNVYVFVNHAENVFNRPSPRLVEGIELLAMVLYADKFNASIPNALGDEYIEYVTGITYTDIAVPVTDSLGRDIPALSTETSIVSVSPSLTELVYALELDASLIAVSDNCNFPLDVLDRKEDGTLKTIGKYNKPNVEVIANLTPGLVILDGGVAGHLSILPQLEEMNITCIVLYQAKTLGNIYNNIDLISNIFGVQTLAREVIGEMADEISSVTDIVADRTANVTMMFSIYFSTTTSVWVAGEDTFNDNAITLAGGENVFGSINEYSMISAEAAFTANPDILVITDVMGKINHTDLWNFLHTDPTWSEISAVKNGKVYIMTGQAANIFDRPSVRVAQGVDLLAHVLYPELFGIEPLPSVIGDEYLTYL